MCQFCPKRWTEFGPTPRWGRWFEPWRRPLRGSFPCPNLSTNFAWSELSRRCFWNLFRKKYLFQLNLFVYYKIICLFNFFCLSHKSFNLELIFGINWNSFSKSCYFLNFTFSRKINTFFKLFSFYFILHILINDEILFFLNKYNNNN